MKPTLAAIASLFLLAAVLSPAVPAQEQPAAPAPSPAPPAPAPPSPAPTATAHITYITGSSVYLDAGQQEGLREGDELQVVRGGTVIARLKVTYLSANRADCAILSASSPLAVGDEVPYVSRPAGTAPAGGGAAGGAGAPPSGPSGGAWAGIHGRVGVHYTEVQDLVGNDNGFSQPGVDLRLIGTALGGSPVDVNLDVRSRRTYRTLPAGDRTSEGDDRVYQLAVSYRLPDPRQQFTLGRQVAASLAAVGLFDGLLYQLDGARMGGGVFAGHEPDPTDMSYSQDITDYGGYLFFHGLPQAEHRWSATVGAIGSYTQGTVNREFLYLQAQYFGKRLSGFLTQEVDYNRGWKVQEAGESTISPTSTFASLRCRATDALTFYAGYDDRRNVRLFRDRVTPVTEFDDSFRQGEWVGAQVRFANHFLAGADLRSSSGGTAGSADSTSVDVGADGLTSVDFSARLRATRYSRAGSDGSLYNLVTGLDLTPQAHLEFTIGTLNETGKTNSLLDRSIRWLGIDFDVALGRYLYLLLSAEKTQGDEEDNNQIYASLTWRF